MIDPRIQAEILQLFFAQKLSRRKIANKLGLSRETVGNVISRSNVNTKVCRASKSIVLGPYLQLIDKLLTEEQTRSAVNILQHIRRAGYTGGISTLRGHLRALRPKTPTNAYFKLEFFPGEAAQVDWGEFGDVFGLGSKIHAFVMVLCWSRMLYLEFTLKETLPTLLRCYENALQFFGGVCREHWHDNMPTVVTERLDHLVRFNTAFLTYAGFRHFKPIACNKNAGHEKGRVEDGVKLVRHQFWPGRKFSNIDDLNSQAKEWRDTFANRREHASTKKIPELLFASEKSSLLPLADEHYDTDEVRSSVISKFYRIHFDGNSYSVPWTMVGKAVTIRADEHFVKIYYGHKLVAKHQRDYRKHQDIKNPVHEEGLREIKPGVQHSTNLETLKSFGPFTLRYLDLISSGNRSLRTEAKELLCLSTVYGALAVEKTIGELLLKGIVGAANLERTLRISEIQPKAVPPMMLQNERLQFVPPLPQFENYDNMLFNSDDKIK